jgi:hypothetical protein
VDGLAHCSGYTPAPTTLNGGGAPVAAVKLVPAWDPLNTYRRDAIYARLSWCASAPAAPCNGTRLLHVNGVLWVWAGWFDTGAFIDNPAALLAPAVLSANCSSTPSSLSAIVGDAGSEW